MLLHNLASCSEWSLAEKTTRQVISCMRKGNFAGVRGGALPNSLRQWRKGRGILRYLMFVLYITLTRNVKLLSWWTRNAWAIRRRMESDSLTQAFTQPSIGYKISNSQQYPFAILWSIQYIVSYFTVRKIITSRHSNDSVGQTVGSQLTAGTLVQLTVPSQRGAISELEILLKIYLRALRETAVLPMSSRLCLSKPSLNHSHRGTCHQIFRWRERWWQLALARDRDLLALLKPEDNHNTKPDS